MARPSLAKQRRAELLPLIARAFAGDGYRRTTTAALAAACELQETQLYRVWPSKKAMFLAAIEYLYDLEVEQWAPRLEASPTGQAIVEILAAEGAKRGESGLHRITFAALSESDDPDIHAAVKRMYKSFHRFIRDTLKQHHSTRPGGAEQTLDPDAAAWAIIGLGTMVSIGREFDLFPHRTQQRLMREAGLHLAGA